MKFTKVKYNEKRDEVYLEFQEDMLNKAGKSIGTIESKLKSDDKPLDSFKEAFKELRIEVENILFSVLRNGVMNGATVTGVSFSYSNDIMGAVITALVPVDNANSPMVVNTPHLPSKPYNEKNDDEPTLSYTCVDKLNTLLEEALKFYNGERLSDPELFEEEV